PRERNISGVRRSRKIHSPRNEAAADLIQQRSCPHIERAHMRAQNVVLGLRVAAEHRCDAGNPDAATQIPHEVKDARSFPSSCFGMRLIVTVVSGTKMKPIEIPW